MNLMNQTEEAMPKMLTLMEIAKATRTSRGTAFTWVTTGGLPHIRVGRVIRVREEDLLAWLASHTAGKTSMNSPQAA
jgi:excisionase family DNA binding protein